jgi:hypothetical protein
MINFGSGLINNFTTWNIFKEISLHKLLSIQYEEEDSKYTIYSIDDIIVYNTIIYIESVPEVSFIDQETNDLYKLDFENNYKNILTNESLSKKSAAGVVANASSKGLGGFVPEPTNNPYEPSVDENVSLYVDGEGSLVTRGGVITDEGSFRDDFTKDLYTELTGTVEFVYGSNEINGIGTLFSEELSRDEYVKYISDGYESWAKILRIKNDTCAIIDSEYQGSTASGVCLKTNWIEISNGSGNSFIENSKINLDIGQDSGEFLYIKKFADYAPMIQFWKISVDNRFENQTIFFGFRDGIEDPKMFCDVILDGYDNKKVKFRSSWDADVEETEILLPANLTTNNFIKYKIDVAPDYCSLLVNNILVAKHDTHVPGMYSEMDSVCGIVNNDYIEDINKIKIDSFYISNQNQVQVSNSFTNPLAVITREDQHTICSKLITSSTLANQVILEYLVPYNKIFYIIGYKLDCSGGASGSPIKITSNIESLEPESPGDVDGDIFRLFELESNSTTGDIDFSIPRKIASGGNYIYVTVTPASALSTIWRANIDFVLR